MCADRCAAFGVNSYSYTFDHTAERFLTELAERGFRTFELMIYPGHLWPKTMTANDRTALRERIESLGVRVVSLNMPNLDVNIAAASEDVRNVSLQHLERIIELAGEIGVPGVIVGPGKANGLFPMRREELLGHFHRGFERLILAAKKSGTRLYAENMPFAFLPRIGDLMKEIERYDASSVQIVYDVANGHFIKEDIAAALHIAAPRLALVHLSDTAQTVYRHDPVGLGDVPFHVVPPVLAEIGHRQQPILEVISAEANATIDDSVRRLLAAGFKPVDAEFRAS